MKHATSPINGAFGVLIEGVSPDDLHDTDFQREAFALWSRHRGVLAVRGTSLAALSPQGFINWASAFGAVEQDQLPGRDLHMVEDTPILRIGNIKDSAGRRRALYSNVPALSGDADVQYNPDTRRPVWHTDSTFKACPPIGSIFHCREAPSSGGDTLFADTRGAFDALEPATQARLRGLEAVCSLAHHDKKISLYNQDYPTLTAQERAANPPRRVPVVLVHPTTGAPAIYGLNSSTCAVVPTGEAITEQQLDVFDLEGIEDDSVLTLRSLLPHITSPAFTIRWRWEPGDVVVWDNRCTMHAASGFDAERDQREMWRLTLQ